MAAFVIPISSDSCEDSVGSYVPRVILFGAIPLIIPVIPLIPVEVPIVPADPLIAPEVGAEFVTSPAGVLDLVDYSSSSDSDPSKDSLPLAPELPLVSLFLLTWRRVSHHSSDHHPSSNFTSDSSSSGSSSDSSSDTSLGSPSDSLSDTSSVHFSGCDASGQSHSVPSTRVASPRFIFPEVIGFIFTFCRMLKDRMWPEPMQRQNVGGSNVARAYTASSNEGRVYVGPHPLYNKCKLHHVGPCTLKCRSCGKIGHLTKDCKLAVPAAVNQRAPMVNQRSTTCFECGRQGNFKKDCPKLKNQNHGNKLVIPKARGKIYAIGGGDANLGSNVVTGHPFNIDLMPVKLGSFDVIISMDWLANNHAVIVCDEKIVYSEVDGERLSSSGASYKEGRRKSQEKRVEDMPIVHKFSEVFPEDLLGLPPVQQVKSQIDLVPGAAPVV
ncbi:putative reverse transcriptase domain-containing protein [Tanacetum coccineum]